MSVKILYRAKSEDCTLPGMRNESAVLNTTAGRSELHRVVILGGGFGGLHAARALRGSPVEVTLVDRRNYHLFQPLLYQVATGGLSPGDIASPLRSALRRQENARVLLGEAIGVEPDARRLVLADGELKYDTLVIATGARNFYFGQDEWATDAPGLKSMEDAIEIRRRVLHAFEAAEREGDPEVRREWLTFVVVGAGPTGVELAGALAEIANDTMKGDFRTIRSEEAAILVVDAADRVLPGFPEELSAKAEQSLRGLSVIPRLGVKVTGIDGHGIEIETDSGKEKISSRNVIWAAGVVASPFGEAVAQATGCELDRRGRVVVEPDLSVPGRPEIFVIGDLALCLGEDGKPLPGVAPVAIQQGKYVARVIAQRLRGADSQPFRYRDQGTLATIGRASAVADFGRLRFSGFPAWLVWLFIHLMQLVGAQNRILVFVQWAFHYFTFNRGARLISPPWPLIATAPTRSSEASQESAATARDAKA